MPAKPKLPRSILKRKILSFFAENEGSIDTPRGIATWINEKVELVRRALEELADEGYLRAHRTPSTIAYSAQIDPKELGEKLR